MMCSHGNTETAFMLMPSALQGISAFFKENIMENILECVFVGAGGALGAICRHLIGKFPVKESITFPITTLFINLLGAFIIGLIVSLAEKHTGFDPRLVLFLKVGVCGGFTTFSTFSLESMQLFQDGRVFAGILYIFLSVALCISAVFAAQAIVA